MWKGWDIMKICGLQKTTLLDFPGHVAATIFTGGCNFRCPFCHNSDLLGSDAPAAFTDEEVLDFLKKRRGILEGAAITGGEPTLQPDLEDFIQKVRALGYQIKLDTNGYRPEVLKRLCEKGLVPPWSESSTLRRISRRSDHGSQGLPCIFSRTSLIPAVY